MVHCTYYYVDCCSFGRIHVHLTLSRAIRAGLTLVHEADPLHYYAACGNLIINYIPPHLTEEELLNLFKSEGPVENVKIVRKKPEGHSLGYAFVKVKHDVIMIVYDTKLAFIRGVARIFTGLLFTNSMSYNIRAYNHFKPINN